MSSQVANVASTQAARVADATARRTAVIADGFVVKLYQEGAAPDDSWVDTDFDAVEADYAGYASVALGGAGFLFDPVSISQDGQVGFSSASAFFQSDDAVTPNVIGGFWVEKTAGAVYRWGPFVPPIPLDDALKFIDMNFFLTPDGHDRVDVQF